MIYNNPIIKGFYPDPSVCKAGDKYYLVCSSFQYFPGVPLFESEDLVNWKQIGHCITRESQIKLRDVESSGGVFAPTLRYNNGRFYMTTTNNTTQQNFYLWTDDIYGQWSDPIYVNQGGIDPSLYFEGDKTFFMSNGEDDYGVSGIVQCEINIETGEKLTPGKTIWTGSGGRYIEGPHMYKINNKYYLVVAEGGTEYGHMVTYAVSDSPYGPFEGYHNNPVLTNRNLGGHEIQGVGHGDLIKDEDGNWWMIHLGFRQIGKWETFHHLGREVFMTPIYFNEDGWFTAGENGTTINSFSLEYKNKEIMQEEKKIYTFENTDWNTQWCYLRIPSKENYIFEDKKLILKGTDTSIQQADSPTFIGIRQKDFNCKITCNVKAFNCESGISIYMDENHHYDIAIEQYNSGYRVIERLNIGDIKSVQNTVNIKGNQAELIVESSNTKYDFLVKTEDGIIKLGSGKSRYLSSEVAGGFTGVIIGLYAYGNIEDNYAQFTNFKVQYK